MKMQRLANEINISVYTVLTDDRYKNEDYVNDVKKEIKRQFKYDEELRKIKNRLRDSYTFNNCMSSSLSLSENDMHKTDIIEHYKGELRLNRLSTLSKQSIKRNEKKIKEQLLNYKKHINKKIITIPDNPKDGLTFTDTDGNTINYKRKDGR